MNPAEKTEIARFLDLSFDTLYGGYRGDEKIYNFDKAETGAALQDSAADSLEAIADELRQCTACPLCKTRTQAVAGEGALQPLVMIIGGNPGQEEDACGRPFAGSAGQLLDKMLASIGLGRDSNCFVTGIVKCKTPGTNDDEMSTASGREPLPGETTACAAFLRRQILLLKPRVILCAGSAAAHSLLRTTVNIDALRGKESKIRIGDSFIPVMVTYHPDDILENEALKRPAWEDLKKLKAWLDACNASGAGE